MNKRELTTCLNLDNKKMNSETYKLRRKVIDYIYDLKKIVDLPRIEVRITESHDSYAGMARMSRNVIWIPENTLDAPWFKQVVVHELAHAVKGLPHDEACNVMASIVRPVTEKELTAFIKKNF